MTPRRFAALRKRHEVERQHAEYRIGVLCATICNVHRDPKKQAKPFVATDFFHLPLYDQAVEGTQEQQNEKQMKAAMFLIAAHAEAQKIQREREARNGNEAGKPAD